MIRRARLVVAAGGVLVLGALLPWVPTSAGAEPIGGDPQWDGEWSDPIAENYEFTGDRAVFAGTLTYTGSPNAQISDIDLTLDWVVDESRGQPEVPPAGCENDAGYAVVAHQDITPGPGGSPSVVQFSVAAVPRCNGVYEVVLVATASVGSTVVDQSPAWVLDAVRVSLRPPEVSSLEATLGPNRAVTLQWAPPEGYEPGATDDATASGEGPPKDFLGYIVQRSLAGSTTWDRIGFYGPNGTLRHVDSTLPATAFGQVRYRVLTGRESAPPSTTPQVSAGDAAPVETIDLGPAPTTSTTAPSPTTTRAAGGGGPRPTAGGSTRPPVTVAPGENDGFEESIDYDDFEPGGGEEPVLPEDATGLIEVGSNDPGQGLTVPIASAMVLGVWAMHLRYLSRRASQPV